MGAELYDFGLSWWFQVRGGDFLKKKNKEKEE